MTTASPPADGFTPMPADPAMIEDIMGWHQKTGDMPMYFAPVLTIESFEHVMQFDATYAARKIAPRAYCIVQLTGHDVYHPNESSQTGYHEPASQSAWSPSSASTWPRYAARTLGERGMP